VSVRLMSDAEAMRDLASRSPIDLVFHSGSRWLMMGGVRWGDKTTAN
jgi:hypothetical protein